MITDEQIFSLVPEKSFVRYAGANYRVAGYDSKFGVWFIDIYDEPPSDHIDSVKAESCELAAPSPVEGEKTAEEILMKNLPKDCFWEEMGNLTNTPIQFVLQAMTEYASLKVQQERNKTIQEGIDLFPRIKDSWIRAELSKLKG